MFGMVDREFLNQHPYQLINGDICKFSNVVDTEDGSQVAMFKNLTNGRVEKITVYQFNILSQQEPITATGRLYELMIELKAMFEINHLK
jgi:hypothetical protein